MKTCTNCGTTDHETTDEEGQWWHLSNYYGLRGTFCSRCYDAVAHDSYGTPENPNAYAAVLEKQRKGTTP